MHNAGQAEIILSNVVWHNKALFLPQMSNDKRETQGAFMGGIFHRDNDSTRHLVIDSVSKCILFESDASNLIGTGDLFKDFYNNNTSTHNEIEFLDIGLTNGSPQPFPDEFKVKVNYKFSQMMGNRLFVGNVRLDPGGDDEDHPDWIIYSEPGMPDILPIVNYIQIKDQQGGEIVGMNKLLDSLVVFMSRGIFRLDIGSTGDPADFRLMESNKNLGCVATKGIVNVQDNLFFCAKDNIYQITPDFTFTPITEAIKDIYIQTATPSASRLFYDVKRHRLICKFGTGTQVYYIYDLTHNAWSKWTTSVNAPDFFTINDTLDVYAISIENVSSGGGGATP